jgi:hypothetical protein
MRTATALTVLALLALPAAAVAQQSPFQPLPPPASTTDTPTVTVQPPTNSGSDSGLKTWQEFLIFGAGLILIIGIGWAIVSDSRNRAPVKDSELGHPGMGGATRRNRSQKQRERERAKAKAGRKQRRRQSRR